MSKSKSAKQADLYSTVKYLPDIHSPADLQKLPAEAIPFLCREIRDTLVETVTQNGGHLASNLGAVELSVAMHRVFRCPHDHFIFDVGHQSYVHKLLTGRYEQFHTLRRGGGLPRPEPGSEDLRPGLPHRGAADGADRRKGAGAIGVGSRF